MSKFGAIGGRRRDTAETPALVCEWPSADATAYVHTEVRAPGWALGAERVTGRLGGASAQATLGLASPDVAQRFPGDPRAERARFELALPTSGCPRGTHVLELVATMPGGRALRLVRPVIVEPYSPPGAGSPEALRAGAIAMSCDTPRLGGDDDDVSAPVRITGWCFAHSAIDRVQAFLDGTRRYDLIFPTPRRDVWRFFGARDALLSGFDLRLDPDDCPPGAHSLVVLATAADGRTVGQSGTFTCVATPAGEDRPDAGTGQPAAPGTDTGTGTGTGTGEDRVTDPARHRTGHADAERRTRYRWAAPLAAGRTVLDVGCRSGEGTAILGAAGATRAVGIERSDVELSPAQAGVDGPVELLAADLASLPFADATFDLVVGFDDIETLPERARLLDELRRVLRPGGVLLISTRDQELLSTLGARWRQVRRWEQQTFTTTAIVDPAGAALDAGELRLTGPRPSTPGLPVTVAGASDHPLPDIPELALAEADLDLRALSDELDHLSLRARVAEKHAVVSTLEGDVIANYHQELLRSHLELRAELEARRGSSPSRIVGALQAVARRLHRGTR